MPTLYKKLTPQTLYQPLHNSDAKGAPHKKRPPVRTIPSSMPPVRSLYQSDAGLGRKRSK
jgi:hypothetical protein